MTNEAFDGAFDEMFRSAYRLAHRMLGDRATAEDVAAEACARAYADWSRVSTLTYRDAWVLRVASNLAIDATRRRKLPQLPIVEPDPSDLVALRMALSAALRALPRRQREAVSLRHLAGLSEKDVAQVLGVSTGSVKTHLSRGLASLRRKLGDRSLEVDLV